MKAIVVQQRGNPVSPNVALVTDRPKPQPQSGEVLVRTEASALNSLDLWVGRGLPGIDTQYPFSSGSDGAGRVEEVGAGVDSAWIGRRILLNAAVIQDAPAHPDRFASGEDIRMIGEHSPGTMGEFFCAPAKNVLDIGDTDPIQAAAFGLTHLTAWRMLMSRAQLRPGMTILVTGIGGGVAVALLNIAKHFGCTVIVTSRHQSKLDRARELGAVHGILDDGSDWSKTVRTLTGKRGVDIVADSIGKAVHSQCIKSLVRGGVFVTCGATTGGDATTDLARMFWNQLTFMGSTMGDMKEFRAVTTFLRSGEMLPVVDSIQKPHDAKKAYERLESGEQFGKVLIDWA
ncbi:MAG: zinc-binding dehydrogenase [Planctomycetota bacterium]